MKKIVRAFAVSLTLICIFANTAHAQKKHRLCELKKTYCATKTRDIRGDLYIADPRQQAMCKQVKDLIDMNSVNCGKAKGRVAAAKRCEAARQPRFQAGANGWMAFSYDTANAGINGYCRRDSAWDARTCAYNQCRRKGGSRCQVPCDPVSGDSLRVCRERFITIVGGPQWARMGCGERYLSSYGGNGEYTRESYVQRELARCLKRHRGQPVCGVQNIFE